MSENSAEQFKRAVAAATRAIAGNGPIDVRFGGESAMVRGTDVTLPTPPRRMTDTLNAQTRGQADALALRLAHHDAAAHAHARPEPQRAREVYDAAEQARVEALGANALAGVADNLDAALQERCVRRGYQRMHDRQDAPIADAVAFLVRETLTGRPLPDAAQGIADLWRDTVDAQAGAALSRLADVSDDPAAFAAAMHTLLVDLNLIEDSVLDAEDEDPSAPEDDTSEEDNQDDTSSQDDDEGADQTQTDDHTPEDQGGERQMDLQDLVMEETAAELDQGVEQEAAGLEPAGPTPEQPLRNAPDAPSTYSVYTTKYDEVVGAEDLCEPDELERLRSELDQLLRPLEGVVARLANRLQRKLLAKQARGWMFDLEEGVLDTARLSRVVTDPTSPLSFKQETETEFRDTVVTLLLDNSGSMRGRPILVAAVCADILARTLERCGVKVEILGFTTRAWKGGRAREAWQKDGRPLDPGRLNDLRHIIYKTADTPYRRARKSLALMRREGLLKENIDGEALQWAWGRLAARPEERRILMVISDGSPVDDSTSGVNPAGYLDRHLREVIAEIENRSEVELLAIGIGHDVTRWYKRACKITDVDQLASAVVHELADLFDENTPRDPRARRRSATGHTGDGPPPSPPPHAGGYVITSGREGGKPLPLGAARRGPK